MRLHTHSRYKDLLWGDVYVESRPQQLGGVCVCVLLLDLPWRGRVAPTGGPSDIPLSVSGEMHQKHTNTTRTTQHHKAQVVCTNYARGHIHTLKLEKIKKNL